MPLRVVAVRKDSGRFLANPQEVYDMLAADLKTKQVPIPNLFWAEDEEEFLFSMKRCQNLPLISTTSGEIIMETVWIRTHNIQIVHLDLASLLTPSVLFPCIIRLDFEKGQAMPSKDSSLPFALLVSIYDACRVAWCNCYVTFFKSKRNCCNFQDNHAEIIRNQRKSFHIYLLRVDSS